MASVPSPVKIGARGTIGSLVSQEIEHFRRLDLGRGHEVRNQLKQRKESPDQRPGSSRAVPRKKKKKLAAGAGFLPSICAAVEISDTKGMERVRGIGYMNMKSDVKRPSAE